MRGKGEDETIAAEDDRITPAYAGKSSMRPQWRTRSEDHPRLCGEKFRLLSNSISL